MKNHKISSRQLIAGLLVFSQATWASDVYTQYSIEKGETLSELAARFIGYPIYSRGGSLEQITAINPQIQDPLRIRIGTLINLPTKEPNSSPLIREIAENNSIESTPMDGYLALGGYVGTYSLRSRDLSNGTNATLVSPFSYGFNAAIGQRYSEKLSGEYGLGYERIGFDAPKQRTVVENLSFGRWNFYASAQYQLAERWKMSLTLPVTQEVFISANPNSTNYYVDKAIAVSPAIATDYSWYQTYDLESSIGVEMQSYIPSSTDSFSTKLGYGISPRIRAKQKFGAWDGETTLGCLYQSQDTNLTNQNVTRFFLSFRLFFDFNQKGKSP